MDDPYIYTPDEHGDYVWVVQADESNLAFDFVWNHEENGDYGTYVQTHKLALHDFLGSFEATRNLLDHGANLEARNKNKRTPLLEAVFKEGVPCLVVQLLIERGADVFACQRDCTALDLVFKTEATEASRYCMSYEDGMYP
jgi:hypothetical protein